LKENGGTCEGVEKNQDDGAFPEGKNYILSNIKIIS
jgi:hypothetical protein